MGREDAVGIALGVHGIDIVRIAWISYDARLVEFGPALVHVEHAHPRVWFFMLSQDSPMAEMMVGWLRLLTVGRESIECSAGNHLKTVVGQVVNLAGAGGNSGWCPLGGHDGYWCWKWLVSGWKKSCNSHGVAFEPTVNLFICLP